MQQIITTGKPYTIANSIPCASNVYEAERFVRSGANHGNRILHCSHCAEAMACGLILYYDQTHKVHCKGFTGTKSYDPYKNNMVAISANFQHVAAANAELRTQIEQLNQTNATLNRTIDETREQLTQIRQEIAQVNQHIESAETSIRTLVRKVASLIQFVPRFVQDASQWLTQLMLGEQIAAPNLAISWIEEHRDDIV